MTPERKFNQDLWYVLQKIRQKSYYSPKKDSIPYDIYGPIPRQYISDTCPSSKEELLILEKLNSNAALKLHKSNGNEIEFIEIVQPKFDEIYDKLKKIFNPPIWKKVEPKKIIITPPLANEGELLISNLYKSAKKNQNYLESFICTEDDFDQWEEKTKVLDNLKKQKLISYETKSEAVDSYMPNGENWPIDIVNAEIKFDPTVLIKHIEKPWGEKKLMVEKLARFYLNLIRIIEAYFKNNQKIDDFLNKSYENLCEEIIILIYKNDLSPLLKFLYEKPFNSLFSAEKELRMNRIGLNDKMNSMRDFYGEIQRLLLIYDIGKEQSNEISKIENYLDEVESKGKTVEKIKPEQITTKVEIIGIPPLKFKDSKGNAPALKTSLKSVKINYNDEEPAINVGNKKVALPPYKNEHCLCREMFERKISESVDWSIIYEEMTGKESTDKENWRTVYDAMNALNKRIQEICNTSNALFTWQEKTIKRNY